MQCLEFRRLCDTDPNNDDPLFAAHAQACVACARELERARKFGGLLLDAMRIDVPGPRSVAPAVRSGVAAGAHAQPLARTPADAAPPSRLERKKHAWIAIAASLVLAVGIGVGLWLGARPQEILAADVVEHVREEPDALREDRPAVDPVTVRNALAEQGIRLDERIGTILYLRFCPFEGKQIVHLVVESGSGPVTILLLDDHLSRSILIDEASYSGRIAPLGNGSIAIIGIGRRVEAAEQVRMIDAVRWEA